MTKSRTDCTIGEAHRGAMRQARGRQRYRQLGRALEEMFTDIVNEPIPADLLELLATLDKRSGKA